MSLPTTPADTPPPPAPPTRGQNITRWTTAAVGLVVGIIGRVRLYNSFFVLPSCDSTRASDTLSSIYRDNKIEVKGISNLTSVSSSSSEHACTGQVQMPDGPTAISYRIFWDGWTARVAIAPFLPPCESPQAAESLRNIYKERNVVISGISDQNTLTSTATENTCSARLQMPSEQMEINYRLFWDGKTRRIEATPAKSQPK